jgi:SAM-dependent methyltransferase
VVPVDRYLIIYLDVERVGAAMWDPGQYLRFGDERGRPFGDLLARVQAASPDYVVDLGCGPGNLTAILAERWPEAEVLGGGQLAGDDRRGQCRG